MQFPKTTTTTTTTHELDTEVFHASRDCLVMSFERGTLLSEVLRDGQVCCVL